MVISHVICKPWDPWTPNLLAILIGPCHWTPPLLAHVNPKQLTSQLTKIQTRIFEFHAVHLQNLDLTDCDIEAKSAAVKTRRARRKGR